MPTTQLIDASAITSCSIVEEWNNIMRLVVFTVVFIFVVIHIKLIRNVFLVISLLLIQKGNFIYLYRYNDIDEVPKEEFA